LIFGLSLALGVGFSRETTKARGILVFPAGKKAEEITVCQGTEPFRAIAVVMEAFLRKDVCFVLTILSLQAIKSGQGNAKTPIKVAQGFKQMRFLLGVFLLLFRAAALRLRQRIGAFSFVGSHRCLYSGDVG
jgi:hypothetical protein